MDTNNPTQWTERTWLAFLLIAASDADGVQEIHELRFARVGLGVKLVDEVKVYFDSITPEKRDHILKESLPQRLPTLKSREKLQKLLKTMVLADGEYGREEQVLVKRISEWLRNT